MDRTIDPRRDYQRRESYAVHAQPHLKGDKSRRRAIPMPQNLDELRSRSANLYGFHPHKMKMHHRGADELHQPEHVEKIEAGDVIVVRGRRHKRDPKDLMTTHQAVYRGHKVEPRPRPANPPAPTSRPFEGESTYRSTYLQHRVEPRPSPKKTPMGRTVPFEGASTYASEYVGHAIGPKPAFKPAPRVPTVPFEGTSTYGVDYPGHIPQPRPATQPPKSYTTSRFEGCSTYRETYIGHALEPKPRPKNVDPPLKKPFDATTEYATKYIENEIPRSRIIYVEPAMSMSVSSTSSL